ncbi:MULTISPECIES: hypothetical protein [unclassified Saccharicrinis]|uniref:hypothetical protein n=1 Tax=unclassified Saccharicrinis TaxID=2646859 RepID=UPI003D331572
MNLARDDIKKHSRVGIGNISCTSCPGSTLFPLETTNYSISGTDSRDRFRTEYQPKITFIKKCLVDVTPVFTPNRDNLNDTIHVRGWGIKKLIYFRVFNRLGHVI